MGKGYSEEFRAEAMKMRGEIGREATARRLKISVNTIDKWKKSAEERVKKEEKGESIKELQEKIKELEKENARIKKENEFLEEAARFFAQARQK